MEGRDLLRFRLLADVSQCLTYGRYLICALNKWAECCFPFQMYNAVTWELGFWFSKRDTIRNVSAPWSLLSNARSARSRSRDSPSRLIHTSRHPHPHRQTPQPQTCLFSRNTFISPDGTWNPLHVGSTTGKLMPGKWRGMSDTLPQ